MNRRRRNAIRRLSEYRRSLLRAVADERSSDIADRLDPVEEREVLDHAKNVGAYHAAVRRGINTR